MASPAVATKAMVVEAIADSRCLPDAFSRATNACVDRIRASAPGEAVPACESAVEIAAAELRVAEGSMLAVYTMTSARQTLASALSSRAVARWMQGDAAAAEDVVRARRLAPGEVYVRTTALALAQPRAAALARR